MSILKPVTSKLLHKAISQVFGNASEETITGYITASDYAPTEGDTVTLTFNNTSPPAGSISASDLTPIEGDNVTLEFDEVTYSKQWISGIDGSDLDGETGDTTTKTAVIGEAFPKIRVTNDLTGKSRVFSPPAITISEAVEPIGVLYEASSWTDLSAFAAPTTGFSVVSNKIRVAATSAELLLPIDTALDNIKITMRHRFKDMQGGDYGLYVGMKSQNSTSSTNSAIGALALTGTSPTVTKPTLYDFYSNTNFLGSAFTPAIDDLIETVVEFSGSNAVVTVNNITQATTSSHSVNANFVSGAPGATHNTGRPYISAGIQSRTHDIELLRVESATLQNVEIACLGDSITRGYFAGAPANRWGKLLGAEISAGSGDKTREALLRIADITDRIRPAKCYIMLGVNDISNGISTGTWQANMIAIDDALTTAGISAVWCYPTASSADTSAVRTFLDAEFAGRVIDTYTPTKGAGTGLNASYDSGDGVHPNAAGNAAIAAAIVASGL